MKTLLMFLLFAVAASVADTQQVGLSPDMLHRYTITHSASDRIQSENHKVNTIPAKAIAANRPGVLLPTHGRYVRRDEETLAIGKFIPWW